MDASIADLFACFLAEIPPGGNRAMVSFNSELDLRDHKMVSIGIRLILNGDNCLR
jgi:hypothetical protein